MEEEQKIFKKGNQTLYFSCRFFPKKVRDDMFRLYSFFGVTENYVNKDKQPKKFFAIEKSFENAKADHSFDAIAHKWDDIDTRAIKNIVHLQNKYKFDSSLMEAFFKSMKMDLDGRNYKTIDQTLDYVYGSAEVISLMVAKSLKLPDESYESVRAEGRALQWMNFVRDIGLDAEQGKCYFPTEELSKYNLKDLSEETAKANPEKFKKFVQVQINRYRKWQTEASKDLNLVPERYQVPIRTVINMYDWTARKIELNPLIVYEKKIKPRKRQVIRHVIKNTAKGSARVTARTTRQVGRGVKKVKPATKEAIPKIKQAPTIAKDKALEIKDKYIEKED